MLEALGWPEGTYELHWIGKGVEEGSKGLTTIGELVRNSIKPSAEQGWEQVVLWIGGGREMREELDGNLVNDDENERFKPPFIHHVVVGKGSESVLRSLKAFLQGSSEPTALSEVEMGECEE